RRAPRWGAWCWRTWRPGPRGGRCRRRPESAALGLVGRRFHVPVLRAGAPAQVAAGLGEAGALLAAMEQHARQLVQRLAIDLALELDHRVERHPVVVPTPGIELRVVRGAQVDVVVATDQSQQEPDLLLPAVVAAPLAPHPVFRHVVAQPVAGAADDADVLGTQPDFLVQLAVHRLLGRFAALDAALRKLPRMLANPLSPEDLVPRIDQDDADVGAIAVTVQHGPHPSIPYN